MPYIVHIVDNDGNPDPVTGLADLIIDQVSPKGIGVFRTTNHVASDIRVAITELLRIGQIVVQPPVVLQVCPLCTKSVGVWHTYSDGSITCTECKRVQ